MINLKKNPSFQKDRPPQVVRAGLFALFLLLATSIANTVCAQTNLPSFSEVEEVVRRANDYWIANHALGNAGWANSTYYTGNQRAFRITGETAYLDRALDWANANQWLAGPESGGSAAADSQLCGQTYVDLYRLDPQPIRMADIDSAIQALVNNPAADNDWWWIDAFYMAGPTFVKLGNEADDPDYFEQMLTMYDYMKTTRGLYDATSGLWWRDSRFIDTEVFWARGNGWVLGGLTRILDELPADAPQRPEMVEMFQTLCAALKPLQGADGMWRSDLLSPGDYPNPETSGTGLFTYSMAWGVRNGLLDPGEYTNTIAKAWLGLTTLALKPSGLVGYVQARDYRPNPADENETHDFGVGAFLLACTEIGLLAADSPSASAWAGPNESVLDLDGSGQELVTLDATATEVYRETVNNYTWWIDGSPIATGITAQVSLPLGTNSIALKVSHSDGQIYTNSVVKTVIAIIPDAGPDQVVWDNDGDDTASVTLDASGTVGTVSSFDWWMGSIWLASGSNTQVVLPLGRHVITLKVLGIGGMESSDEVVKHVTPVVIATASTYQDGNPPEHTVDDDLGTRWSADGDGQWISFDMGSTNAVSALHCAFYLGNARQTFFTVQTSLDGSVWATVGDYTSSGTTLDRERFSFPSPMDTRHVRIIGHGNSSSSWNSYTEVTIEAQSSMEDADADTLPDRWEMTRFGNLSGNAGTLSDTDLLPDGDEYIAGTDPSDELDVPELSMDLANEGTLELTFATRAALGPGYTGLERKYAVEQTTNLLSNSWVNVTGWGDTLGDNLLKTVKLVPTNPTTLYRLSIWLQPMP